MMDGYYVHGGGTDIWGFIFMLFMMVLVVIGIIVLVRYLGHGLENHSHNQDEALSLLKKRFASGDIDKKEFEEKRKVLSD